MTISHMRTHTSHASSYRTYTHMYRHKHASWIVHAYTYTQSCHFRHAHAHADTCMHTCAQTHTRTHTHHTDADTYRRIQTIDTRAHTQTSGYDDHRGYLPGITSDSLGVSSEPGVGSFMHARTCVMHARIRL